MSGGVGGLTGAPVIPTRSVGAAPGRDGLPQRRAAGIMIKAAAGRRSHFQSGGSMTTVVSAARVGVTLLIDEDAQDGPVGRIAENGVVGDEQ